MKIHFSASGHDEAKLRFARLTERYGQHSIEDANCMVALGGDGHMLPRIPLAAPLEPAVLVQRHCRLWCVCAVVGRDVVWV